VSDLHGEERWATGLSPDQLAELIERQTPPKRRRWPYVLLAVAVIAAAAGVGMVVFREKDPGYPSAWDSRVQEYVDIVEKERDLEFKHPVHVDFLSEAAFKKRVTADEDELTDTDREEIEQVTGMFRALGLIEGDLDLFDTVNQLKGSGIIGYYSYEDERVRIRGTELTPAVQSTLVHELTHALQDQYFDLGKRLKEADDSASSAAFEALVEGDARRIETKWRSGLAKKEQKQLEKSEAEQSEGFDAESADVPEVLKTLMAAPYVFGEALLRVAVQKGGERAVDELFRSPPTTEEHQLDPWTLIADHQGQLTVPPPTLEDGDKEFDDGPFGAVSLMLVLAERIPIRQALTAADGWGGDSYIAFDRDSVSCVKVEFRGETAKDLVEMQSALTRWANRVRNGPTTVTRDSLTISFESCDPGPKAAAVSTGGATEAVSLAVTRTYLSASLVEAGMDETTARCSANRLVRRFTVAELNDPKLDPKRVAPVIAPCQAGPKA
jgi:hypothetical protein